jgi:hypothetical protein
MRKSVADQRARKEPVYLPGFAERGAPRVIVLRGTTAYVENVAATRRAADWAHERGLFIEAELGQVGGKDGVRLVRTSLERALIRRRQHSTSRRPAWTPSLSP